MAKLWPSYGQMMRGKNDVHNGGANEYKIQVVQYIVKFFNYYYIH
jgi:hypothetical protein